MTGLPLLRTELLDLLAELRFSDIPLIIGGGYGIFLKTEHVRRNNFPTILSEWPETRATSDIDLFLRPELLIQPGRLLPLAEAIRRLGYSVIPSAEKYQFVKKGKEGIGEIKIDILTGPQSRFTGSGIKADNRRVHPNPSVGLHAHPVNEAPTLENHLLAVPLSGMLTNGQQYSGEVYIPHPYTCLMMKLFAFKDRVKDQSKEFGRYHALDLYSIVATTMETEWNMFSAFRGQLNGEPIAQKASEIVAEYFSRPSDPGILRMRESRYFRPNLQIKLFIDILRESFERTVTQ